MSTTAPILRPAPAETPFADTVPAWKAELNAKLTARRSRQTHATAPLPTRPAVGSSAAVQSMAAQVAARVAERYAKAPSYSEVLAARAVAAAEAAQHAVAAAQQAHEAAQSLLSGVADGPEFEQLVESATSPEQSEPSFFTDAPVAGAQPLTPAAATVTHPEPLPTRAGLPERRSPEGQSRAEPLFLDPRYDPREEATVSPAQTVPSKLIEFPRELIAPHKPRPRLAEGPLTEDDDTPQLRIFEVESKAEVETSGTEAGFDEMSVHAAARKAAMESRSAMHDSRDAREGMGATVPAQAPEWQSIRLGEQPEESSYGHRAIAPASPASVQAALHTASLEDRLMAALVDSAVVGLGFLTFVLMFAAMTPHLALGKALWASAAVLLIGLSVLYEWLFMSYGSGTPGMRYARIALCTFNDDNPTRAAMRARVGATLLAVLPLGLGLVWALFDEDRLGWQDRITRTYQRSYR